MSTLQKITSITETKAFLLQSEANLKLSTEELSDVIDGFSQAIPHMSREQIETCKVEIQEIILIFKISLSMDIHGLIEEYHKRFETLLQMFDSRIDQIS